MYLGLAESLAAPALDHVCQECPLHQITRVNSHSLHRSHRERFFPLSVWSPHGNTATYRATAEPNEGHPPVQALYSFLDRLVYVAQFLVNVDMRLRSSAKPETIVIAPDCST